MPSWPGTLPDSFEHDSYRFIKGSGVIRTSMDTGPPKIRRRFTATYDRHGGVMVMTKTLYEGDFLTFFETTIAHGSLTFTFPDPFDLPSGTITARWVIEGGVAFEVIEFSPSDVQVAFAIEELPP
nr:hypothetical protein 1 [bacterium]